MDNSRLSLLRRLADDYYHGRMTQENYRQARTKYLDEFTGVNMDSTEAGTKPFPKNFHSRWSMNDRGLKLLLLICLMILIGILMKWVPGFFTSNNGVEIGNGQLRLNDRADAAEKSITTGTEDVETDDQMTPSKLEIYK